MNDYQIILKDLIRIARSKNVSVRIDIDTTGELWRRSACYYVNMLGISAPYKIQLYGNDAFIKAIVLAHEVGHVFTTDNKAYEKNPVKWELLADKWALRYLESRLGKLDLKKAKDIFASCIKNYREA